MTDHELTLNPGDTLKVTVPDVVIPEPEPEPEPEPTPPGGLPTEIAALAKPPAGWQVIGYDRFDRPIPQGEWGKPGGAEEFPKMTFGNTRWRPTAYSSSGNDSSQRGHYSGKDVAWVEGGELREFVRWGKKGVVPFKHDPTGVPLVNRPLLIKPGNTPSLSDISRWPAICIDLWAAYPGGFIQGFKCAHLLWGEARINQVGYAEYDFPEMKFGTGPRGNVFFHNEGTVGGQESKRLETDTTVFHYYRLLYHAQGYKGHPTGYAEAWLDGKLVLRKTTNISEKSLYYAKQTETYLKADPLPTPTAQGPQGIIRTRYFQIAIPE